MPFDQFGRYGAEIGTQCIVIRDIAVHRSQWGLANRTASPYDRRIMLTLPLWIVTEHIQPSDPENNAEKKSGTALAFSTSDKLFKFMKANLGGEWKMQMADDRDGLVILIADLHRLEIESLALDPNVSGTGGEQIALVDLVAFADTLR